MQKPWEEAYLAWLDGGRWVFWFEENLTEAYLHRILNIMFQYVLLSNAFLTTNITAGICIDCKSVAHKLLMYLWNSDYMVVVQIINALPSFYDTFTKLIFVELTLPTLHKLITHLQQERSLLP